jgi:hypothetical protein
MIAPNAYAKSQLEYSHPAATYRAGTAAELAKTKRGGLLARRLISF